MLKFKIISRKCFIFPVSVYLGDDAYNHHDVAVIATEVIREGHREGQLGIVDRVVRHQGDRVGGVRLEYHASVLRWEGDNLKL